MSAEHRLEPEYITIPGQDIDDGVVDRPVEGPSLPECDAVRSKDSYYVKIVIPFIGCGTERSVSFHLNNIFPSDIWRMEILK